jgi:hypothetical protein
MNLSELPLIRISSPRANTATVNPYGFDMECEYEHDPGEPPIYSPAEIAHPGTPPDVQLLSCMVGGVDLMEMLSSPQIARIEDAILEQLED